MGVCLNTHTTLSITKPDTIAEFNQSMTIHESGLPLQSDLIHLPFALWDRLPVAMFVLDMENHEILYANQSIKTLFGEIEHKRCWRVLQEGQHRPCSFCPNHTLFDTDGMPGPPKKWRHRNTMIDRWLEMTESAIVTENGRRLKIQFSLEMTEAKTNPDTQKGAIAAKKPMDMIAMCCNCHHIRDDGGNWQHPALYIQQNLGPRVSHGICAKCVKALYPDLKL